MSTSKFKQWFLAIVLFSIFTILLLLPQISNRFINIGSDITFHYGRFYDLAQQISQGKFNYYQSNYGFAGSGRIINAVYGYDLAFINALLLVITKSWFKFQIVSSFLCLVTAGVCMFSLLRKLNNNYFLCIIGSLLYMTSAPFHYFIQSIGFSGWGSALLPLIFIPAVNVVQNQKNPINPIFLGTSVAILFNAHMLSTFLGILAIFPFFIVGFFKTQNKWLFINNLVLSIILFILLSLNTIIAYIDVFFSNSILSPYIPSSFVEFSTNLSISADYGKYNLGLLFGGIFLFQIVYTVMNYSHMSRVNRMLTMVGSVFLILSTPLMPWDLLVSIFPSIAIIQFPYRLSFVSYILILASFITTLNDFYYRKESIKYQKNIKIVGIIACIFSFSQLSNVISLHADVWKKDPIAMGNNRASLLTKDKETIRNNLKSPDLNKLFETIQKGSPDYLPIKDEMTSELVYQKVKPYEKVKEEIYDNQKGYDRTILDDGRIQLTFDTKNTEQEEIILPIIIYGHSTVEFNGKELSPSEYSVSDIGSLILNPQKGTNTVVVGYQPSINMGYVLIIKLITTLGIGMYFLYYATHRPR